MPTSAQTASSVERSGAGTESLAGFLERNGTKAASWALPFGLIVYLGLKDGGYDAVVRGEVGIAVWWIVLLGALVGVLPATRVGRAGWIGLGLLAGYAVWTALAVGWSENSERSLTEVARVATYLGVFTLVLAVRKPGDLRRTVNGLAAGLTLIGLLALLSRLHPGWFPDNETALFLADTEKRLHYPVGYWNDLAALMAIGIPLLLAIGVHARSLAGQALATAAVPALALAAFYTLSRGGAVEIAVAVVVLFALLPRRVVALPTFAVAGIGSAILIAAAAQRDDLLDGLSTPAASSQGDEMLAITLVVCGGVGLIAVAIGLMSRYEMLSDLPVPRRMLAPMAGGVALVALFGAVAAGVPGEISDRWDEFKQPGGAGTGVSRFESSSGSGRYQTWSSAIDANEDNAMTGAGPGTFEFHWSEQGDVPLFVRDAHSLYLESLGELGIIGFLLIAGFVVAVLGFGGIRASQGDPERRWPYAAATAGAAAFAVAAGIDWAWELAVLPVAMMFLAAGVLAPRSYRPRPGQSRMDARIIFGVLGVLAVVAIAIPTYGANQLRDSQEKAAAGDLEGALDSARSAHDTQPYAASPLLQEALVLELTGDLPGAVAAARDATDAGSTDWRNWLTLSRLEVKNGNARGGAGAYARARQLNPRSPLFAKPVQAVQAVQPVKPAQPQEVQ